MYEIEYNGEKIQYELIRSNIKNMYIQIKNQKVIVKVPNKMKNLYIVKFVNKKANWIYKNLKESEKEQRDEKFEQKDIDILSKIVEEKIGEYSIKLGITPNKVRIRNIKYAWGTCSNKRNITINMQLAKKSETVIEYVVVHEMCHLVYMNHSKEFWGLVEKYIPNYKECRKALRKSV